MKYNHGMSKLSSSVPACKPSPPLQTTNSSCHRGGCAQGVLLLPARYNGHPDFAHMSKEFHTALASSDTVAVVGVGNVALDCARVLAKGEDSFYTRDSSMTDRVDPCVFFTWELHVIFVFDGHHQTK